MKFDELNDNNYLLFAVKYYNNPQAVTKEDFYEDLKRFKWIKRLLKKYKTTGDLNAHLLINHFIVLYNIFGDAATPLLFYKIDCEFWNVVKTFVVYLGRLPDCPRTKIHDIEIDEKCLDYLNKI